MSRDRNLDNRNEHTHVILCHTTLNLNSNIQLNELNTETDQLLLKSHFQSFGSILNPLFDLAISISDMELQQQAE